MHIHSVIVSYNRKSLTEQTLQSYLETVSIPYSIMIVDNGSDENTKEWLSQTGIPVLFLNENKFPGYATNRGWEKAPPETTFYHRIDNDTLFLPGWCENMISLFDENPEAMQYGLVAAGDEEWTWMHVWPCGGNSVIKKEIYDQGLRYSERPWTEGGILEEHQLTLDVWSMGYQRIFATRPVIQYLIDIDDTAKSESKKLRGL